MTTNTPTIVLMMVRMLAGAVVIEDDTIDVDADEDADADNEVAVDVVVVEEAMDAVVDRDKSFE